MKKKKKASSPVKKARKAVAQLTPSMLRLLSPEKSLEEPVSPTKVAGKGKPACKRAAEQAREQAVGQVGEQEAEQGIQTRRGRKPVKKVTFWWEELDL